MKSYASAGKESKLYRQVVNNAQSNRFSASDIWKTSSYNSERIGEDYAYANPGTVNDPEMFRIRVPEQGKYAIFARWPADPGYNSEVQFTIRTASGWAIRTRNQQKNGGKWVGLGRFTMPAGDGWWVRIRRKSETEGYVIADAVLIKAA